MICIKPMAPTQDVASAAPRLSACMTARTHASGRPNRRAASAMYAAHLSIVGEPFWGATVAPSPNDALQLSSAPSGTNSSALTFAARDGLARGAGTENWAPLIEQRSTLETAD